MEMASDGTIRKQWNEAVNSWLEFVRSGRDYYREYLNGPALKRMMGAVEGKRVLDIGCGEGYYSRLFAKMGAIVTGVDFSETMIKAAREEEARNSLGINYHVADAAELNMLSSDSFDIAFSYMSFMDIADYGSAVAQASRVLRKGGRFIVLMTHPCFHIRMKDGNTVSGWEKLQREDGFAEYLYYKIEDYFQRHAYTVEWKNDRLPSSFVTTSFHRTLSDYVNTFTRHGLAVTGLDEPQPLMKGVKIMPSLQKHCRVPQSIVIEATKVVG
jgi:ubiquinone/menaquinone biosynthesis C-methylase UbiE